MAYTVALPDGRTVEFPDDLPKDKAAAVIRQQFPQFGAPETTAFGQVKEGFKGLIPGAVGLLESAATGASALLPEDMEKTAREKIKSVATAAKEPFAAAPGYEESIPRKLSEAVGSTLPFLAAGPLGLAGRAAAVGLGVGAGAGESRTRAEEAGATGEQRSTATALGVIPGALEAFAPLRILSRIPTASKAAGVEAVKRAMIAGGEEAAQEAASGFAQNLIAKGVYKPEQALIEGLGEQAAYGGATGALVQGLMDLALGRRARGATAPEAPPAEPGPQIAPEAPAGTQGTLFTPEEMGKPVPAPKAPEEPVATAVPEGQQDLGLDFQREYADLVKERERLKQQPQTPEVKARIQELTGQMALYNQSDIESLRAEAERTAAEAQADVAARKKFPGLANAPDLMTQPDDVKARTQGELFPGEDLGTAPTPEAPVAEPTLRSDKEKAPLQYKLPLRAVREDREPKRDLPMPERAAPLTMQDVLDVNIPLRRGMQPWFEQNVVGKTLPELQAMVKRNPKLVEGPSQQAKILRELTAPQPVPFKEAPRVKPTPTETPAVEQRVEPGAGEPSVGVPSEPAPAELAEPGAGAAPAAEAPVTPDGLGLVSAGQPAVPGTAPKRAEPPAVTPPPDDLYARAREETSALPTAELRAKLAQGQKQSGPLYTATHTDKDPITGTSRTVSKRYRVARMDGGWTVVSDANGANPSLIPPSSAAAKTDEDLVLDQHSRFYYTNDVRVSKGSKAGKAPKPATTVTPPAVTPPVVETETADAEAARKAEADDFRRRLEALEKAKPPAPKAAPAPAPKVEKPAPKEIPEKLREPVGTTDFGGEDTILRGPQALLFPMSKREEIEYAEARRKEADAKEDIEPAPKADTRQMELVFPPDEAAIARAVDGKTVLEAANWAATNLPDVDQRMIAKRVAATLRELQSVGVIMGPVEVTPSGQRLASGARGMAGLKPGPNGMPSTVRVKLNHPSNGDQSGTTPETLLHELIHTATMGALSVGNRKSAANTRIGKTVTELYNVAKAVLDHVDAKYARGETLNDIERQLRTNYMRDVDEILAWSMTNRDMQAYMETVPYKNSNLWTQFVQVVRNVLGLTAKADTALSEILRIGGVLTELTSTDLQETSTATGKQFSIAPGTEALINSMGPMETQEKPLLRKIVDGFKAQDEVNYAVKFRTQVADSAATIEHRLRNDFDGAVKDKLGKFNPMGLYRQAQDYSKMLLEYMQVGGIAKEPATGLWKVASVKDPKTGKPVRPPVEVYALIDKWAAKNGYSRERGTQIASRILEGVRLDAMRTSNKNDGTEFLLHLKDNEIDQLVREYKADPDLQAMSKAMDEARLAMVDNLVAVGRLSAEQGKAWKDVAGYVPFDRIEDFASGFSKIKKISNKGLAQVGKLPELVGSINRPVGNVFDNYLNTLGWMVGQTLKTDGTVRTLRSLEDAGHAKYLGRSPQGKDNTVGMYVKGEMMYWELPSKYDVLAFKDLNPPKAKWLQVLGQASNVLRKAVTVLPPFALKQVTDDVQRAIMTSGVKNPGALLRMTLTNFGGLALAELRGIQHPTVKEFGALGLTGEYDFQQGKPAASVLKDLGYKPRGKFETLLHRLDGITRASDLAVRKAIYDQTLKEGGDQLLAQTRAREFINFRRRGASDFVGAMVTTIPFFNAYIQGMDVLYRAASGKDSSSSVGRAQARRMFWSRAAIAMTLSTLYAMGADDDEDYQEMDLRTRDSNWILPGGYKLPVPGELGALFKVIPERVVEYMRRQGTPEEQEAWEATRTALRYIMEQYVGRVVPVPQGVKPLLEAWTNYSFFTGRELEGIYQKQQDPSLRRASNTSELAIAISEFSRDVVGVDKVSPIMIDNALSGYFGSTAGLLVAVTDSLLNPTRVDRPLHKWALLSNYLYDPVGTRRMTEFYEEREKVGRANTTLNELMKTDLDKAATYAEAHADELMLESAVNSTLEQLESTRAYRKYLNSAEGAKDVSKQEREDQLKEIKQLEVELTGWLREAKTSLRQ